MGKGSSSQQLWLFFVIIFLISVPAWILGVILQDTRLPLDTPMSDLLATLSPLIAACTLTYRSSGRDGVGKLLRRALDFRKIAPRWWGMIVGVPLALFVVIRLVLGMLGYSVPGGIMVSMGAMVLLMLFFLAGDRLYWLRSGTYRHASMSLFAAADATTAVVEYCRNDL